MEIKYLVYNVFVVGAVQRKPRAQLICCVAAAKLCVPDLNSARDLRLGQKNSKRTAPARGSERVTTRGSKQLLAMSKEPEQSSPAPETKPAPAELSPEERAKLEACLPQNRN